MWASISAERNESSIKWNRDWCSCSTPRKINWSHLEGLQQSNAKDAGSLQNVQNGKDILRHAELQPARGHRTP